MRPVLFVGFKAYNVIFSVARSRAVIFNEKDEVLLVQHWAGGSRWSLPGGGVERGETALEALQREMREELGLSVGPDQISYFTTIHSEYEAPIFIVRIQQSWLPPQPFNKREISEAAWATLDSLPSRLTPIARRVFGEMARDTKICYTERD